MSLSLKLKGVKRKRSPHPISFLVDLIVKEGKPFIHGFAGLNNTVDNTHNDSKYRILAQMIKNVRYMTRSDWSGCDSSSF